MVSPDHSHIVPSISRDMRALYEAHFPFVWRYLAHRGVPNASLDDLLLDVFRIVREHPSRHDPAVARSVFVCVVARQVLRAFKRQNRSPSQHDEAELEDGPTQTFSRKASAQVLDAAVEQMTELQREVLLLCEGEKMSTREVAAALGVGESTVQLRLSSAQKALKAFVQRLRSHPLWDAMADVTPAQLIAQAQAARTPTDHDRERVFASMLAHSLAGGAGQIELIRLEPLPSPTAAAPPQAELPIDSPIPPPGIPHAATLSPPPPGTALTWVAAALTALAIGSGTYIAVASGRPAPPAVDSRAAELLPVPSVADEPRVSEAEVVKPRPLRNQRPNRKARRVRRDGGADARQLFAAETALKLGKTRLALDLVNEHAAKYPRSGLVSERAALRAQILCDMGRTKAARRVVLELEAAEASGQLLASVDQACTH